MSEKRSDQGYWDFELSKRTESSSTPRRDNRNNTPDFKGAAAILFGSIVLVLILEIAGCA